MPVSRNSPKRGEEDVILRVGWVGKNSKFLLSILTRTHHPSLSQIYAACGNIQSASVFACSKVQQLSTNSQKTSKVSGEEGVHPFRRLYFFQQTLLEPHSRLEGREGFSLELPHCGGSPLNGVRPKITPNFLGWVESIMLITCTSVHTETATRVNLKIRDIPR